MVSDGPTVICPAVTEEGGVGKEGIGLSRNDDIADVICDVVIISSEQDDDATQRPAASATTHCSSTRHRLLTEPLLHELHYFDLLYNKSTTSSRSK